MNEFLTTAEACLFLGISWPRFIELRKRITVPFYTTHLDKRKKLYKKSDLESLAKLLRDPQEKDLGSY